MEQTSHSNRQDSESSTQQGGQVKEQAKQQAQQVAQQGERKAGQVADQARQKAKGQLSAQKERAAGCLGSVAQALRQSGQHLKEQNQVQVGQYTEKAAEQVERFSGHLRERDVDQLTGEAEDFARKRPALFLGGAFALGLLGTRFLKSSSSGRGSGSSQHGSSGGDDSMEIPTATSRGAISYGTQEEATTALPPGPIDEEPPRAAGQPLRDRMEPPPPRRGSS